MIVGRSIGGQESSLAEAEFVLEKSTLPGWNLNFVPHWGGRGIMPMGIYYCNDTPTFV